MKSLFKTVFIIIFFTGLTRLAGFIFRIWLSRTIGAESLGVYQISFSIFMVLLTIVSSGIPLIISRMTAKYVAIKDKKSEQQTLSSAVIISLGLSVVISLIVLILQKPISYIFADERCIIILLTLLPALIFSSVYSAVRGNLWGRNKYVASCSAELFEQLIRILVCILLLSGLFPIKEGAIGASLSLSIACVFSCIFVVILYFKSGGKFTKPKGYKEIIKTSTPITTIRVASSLIQPVVALIIPLRLVSAGYTSAQSLSLYGIATGMTLPLLFIPMTLIGSLSYALIPDLSSANAKNETKYISSRISTSIIFSLFVAFFMVPLFMGAGQNLGVFFFDNAQSGILLSEASWIIIPMCLTNISSSILNAVGYEIKSFKNYIVGVILMLLCIWFLPKYIGINALIWAMGSCFTVSAILNIKMIKKYITKDLKIARYFWIFTAFLLPSAAITSFCTNLLNGVIPLFFNLAISCSIGATFFILLGLIFNVYKFSTVLVWIKTNNPLKKHNLKRTHKV